MGLDRLLVHNIVKPDLNYLPMGKFDLETLLFRRVAALHNGCHRDETNRTCDEPNRLGVHYPLVSFQRSGTIGSG